VRHSKRILILAAGAMVFFAMAIVAYRAHLQETKNEVLLGAVLPLTGPYAEYGTVPKNAIQLAIRQRKAAGFPYEIAVQYEDSQMRPDLALTAIRKLIEIDHVPVIFGAAGSNETEVIGPIAQQNHVVLVSPSSTAANLSNVGNYFFRTIPTDTYEGTFMARFVHGCGITRIAILAVNDTGTKSLADSFRNEFVTLGGSVVKYALAPKDTNDVRTQIASIRSASPQAVFMVGYAAETAVFLRQASELALGLPVYSAHPAEAAEVRQIAGIAADGVIFSTPAHGADSPAGRNFADAYHAAYGQQPGEFAPEAYDAAMLVLDAIQKVGPSPTAIRDYLHQVHNYPGASGQITFSSTGDVQKPINVMTIRHGKVVPYDSVPQ
jgi:branched-chain amino acid transport system substrate-binding protein